MAPLRSVLNLKKRIESSLSHPSRIGARLSSNLKKRIESLDPYNPSSVVPEQENLKKRIESIMQILTRYTYSKWLMNLKKRIESESSF